MTFTLDCTIDNVSHSCQTNRQFDKSCWANRLSLFSGSMSTRHYGTHWTDLGNEIELLCVVFGFIHISRKLTMFTKQFSKGLEPVTAVTSRLIFCCDAGLVKQQPGHDWRHTDLPSNGPVQLPVAQLRLADNGDFCCQEHVGLKKYERVTIWVYPILKQDWNEVTKIIFYQNVFSFFFKSNSY